MSSNPPFPRLQRGKMITNGLVGCWRFSEGSGLKAYDISGNENHGTLVGGPTWVGGREGSALSFDGTDDYVGIVGAGDIPTLLTVSAWIYPQDATATQGIAANARTDTAQQWRLEYGRTDSRIGFVWNDVVVTASNADISTNVWHHVVGIRSGSIGNWTVSYFVDGASNGSTSSIAANPSATDTGISIGNRGLNATNGLNFNGLLDDVRLYNRALSAEEVAQIYSGHG